MNLSICSAPTVGVRHTQTSTSSHIQNENLGSGTLYVAESQLSWIREDNKGFVLNYPSISLHAVSRDTSTFPHPCLYLMVEGNPLDVPGLDDEDSDTEQDDTAITEIRFVPSSPDSLEEVFRAMSDCQALHPDEDDSLSDFDDEDDEYCEEQTEMGAGDTIYTRQEDMEVLTPQGRATLQHLENLLINSQPPPQQQQPNGTVGESMDDEQFDDA